MKEDSEEKAQSDAAVAVRKMRNAMPLFLEMSQMQARVARARYTALVDAGFTETQALELCTKDIRI